MTAQEPVATRDGLDANVIWQAEPADDVTHGQMAGETVAVLDVREIRVDENRIYFDVVHRAERPALMHPGTSADLQVRLNHCEAPNIRVSGTHVIPIINGTMATSLLEAKLLHAPLTASMAQMIEQ